MALPSTPIQVAADALARAPIQKGVRRDVRWTAKGKAVVDEAAKTAEFYINSDQDDRDEEVVLPSAVLAAKSDYLANPIFLWGHAHRGTPDMALGTCLDITGDETLVRAKFQYDVEIPGLASDVFKRVAKGTIRAVSIGFIPKRWVMRHSPQVDIDALPTHVAAALVSGKIWVVHTEIELIEISQCFIGSNRQALAVGLAFGDDLLSRLVELVQGKSLAPDPKDPLEENVKTNQIPVADATQKAAEPAVTDPAPVVDEKAAETQVPAEPAPDAAKNADPAEKAEEVISVEEFRALQAEVAEQSEVIKMLLSGAIESGF